MDRHPIWQLDDPADIAPCLAESLERLSVCIGASTKELRQEKADLMRTLNKFVATSDWILDAAGYTAFARVLGITRLEHTVNSQDDVYNLSIAIISHDSFDPAQARHAITLQLVARLYEGLHCPGGVATLGILCHKLYDVFKPYRPALRKEICTAFRGVSTGSTEVFVSHQNTGFYGKLGAIPVHLRIASSIIRGIEQLPISKAFNPLLNGILELHAPNKMTSEQVAVISTYHAELVGCCVALIKIDERAAEAVILSILKHWPKSNTQKEALMVSELETVIELTPVDLLEKHLTEIWTQIATCMASDHSRVSETALMMWSGDYFLNFAMQHLKQVTPIVLYALLREGNKHWNPTVNSMTCNVLDLFTSTPEGRKVIDAESIKYWRALPQYKNLSEDDCLRFTEEYHNKLRKDKEAVDAKKARKGQDRPLDSKLFGDKLRHSDFVFSHGELGEGSYSKVRFCKLRNLDYDQSEWQEFAIKSMDKEFIAQQNYVENIEREIAMMKSFDHPNIAKLFTVFEDHAHIHIVLEYCKNGDLHSYIHKLGSLDLSWARFVTAEIVASLEYLHDQGILYNDLKPENVLLDKENHVKLTDFGSARFIKDISANGDDPIQSEGTADYLSPEEVAGRAASTTADLWSLGCLVFQLFAGRTPYWAETQEEIFSAIVHFERTYPSGFPEVARELVDALLVIEPEGRLGSPSTGGFEALKSHAFFDGLDFASLAKSIPPAPAGGAIGPAMNAKWTQRTYSMLIAPVPAKYSRDAGSELPVIPEELPNDTVWPGEPSPPSLEEETGMPAISEDGSAGKGGASAPRRPPAKGVVPKGVRTNFEVGQVSVFSKPPQPR